MAKTKCKVCGTTGYAKNRKGCYYCQPKGGKPMSGQHYVEIKPKHCSKCGKDYTPIVHSDECPHNKVGVSEQKRLDRPELREKDISTCIWRALQETELLTKYPPSLFNVIVDTATKEILALFIPDIEEAKKQEAEAIIRCIKDAKRVHPDWTVDDVIELLQFREETRQALQGLEEG